MLLGKGTARVSHGFLFFPDQLILSVVAFQMVV